MKSEKIIGAEIKTKSLGAILAPLLSDKETKQDDKKIVKEAKARRKALEKQLATLLRTNFPSLFNEESPKPLAIGIHHEIAALYPQFSGVTIRKFLKKWVKNINYLNAVLSCPSRHKLNGDAVALVSDGDREYAQKLIDTHSEKLMTPVKIAVTR